MATKRPKSLTERISALINRVGEKPQPTFAYIKSELVDCLGLAETLQNGAAVREAEAKVTALETALEKSEAAREGLNAELGKLQSELQRANAEVKSYEAEQKKREEKEGEIHPAQFQILDLLPSPSGINWLRSDEIARDLKIPLDEADAYIDGLRTLNYIIFHPHEPGGGGWRRTESGNTLAIAKRRAGKEEEKKRHKYADLPEIQQQALVMISEGDMTEREIARSLDKKLRLVRHHLHSLRDADMATDAEEHPGDAISVYSAGDADGEATDSPMWRILRDGERYLAERDLL